MKQQLLTFLVSFWMLPPADGFSSTKVDLFWHKFKADISSSDVNSTAKLVHFPVAIYGRQYSEAEFLTNNDGSINFFDRYIISEIAKTDVDDLIQYSSSAELEAGDCSVLPKDSPVFECDIVREKGGPALRLLFARDGESYKLFCLVE
jgi:hypothetical protein